MNNKSILESTKKVLNIHPDDPAFDVDVMMHVNAAFSTLQELGVGPDEGFMIEDKNAEWDDFIPKNLTILNMVKIYIYLSVRTVFDPPASSFAMEAMKEQLQEKAWRLQVMSEDFKQGMEV